MKTYSTRSTLIKPLEALDNEISEAEIQGLIGLVAELIGVEPSRLRNRRTLEIARPYRHALWHILHAKYGCGQRWLARYFDCSRNTVSDGLKAMRNPDDAHKIALVLIKAKINRLGIGL